MKIIVYGRKECAQCYLTKTWLYRLDLPFEYIDIDQDDSAKDDAKRMLKELNSTTLPIVVASDGEYVEKWSGFKLNKIKWIKDLDSNTMIYTYDMPCDAARFNKQCTSCQEPILDKQITVQISAQHRFPEFHHLKCWQRRSDQGLAT